MKSRKFRKLKNNTKRGGRLLHFDTRYPGNSIPMNIGQYTFNYGPHVFAHFDTFEDWDGYQSLKLLYNNMINTSAGFPSLEWDTKLRGYLTEMRLTVVDFDNAIQLTNMSWEINKNGITIWYNPWGPKIPANNSLRLVSIFRQSDLEYVAKIRPTEINRALLTNSEAADFLKEYNNKYLAIYVFGDKVSYNGECWEIRRMSVNPINRFVRYTIAKCSVGTGKTAKPLIVNQTELTLLSRVTVATTGVATTSVATTSTPSPAFNIGDYILYKNNYFQITNVDVTSNMYTFKFLRVQACSGGGTASIPISYQAGTEIQVSVNDPDIKSVNKTQCTKLKNDFPNVVSSAAAASTVVPQIGDVVIYDTIEYSVSDIDEHNNYTLNYIGKVKLSGGHLQNVSNITVDQITFVSHPPIFTHHQSLYINADNTQNVTFEKQNDGDELCLCFADGKEVQLNCETLYSRTIVKDESIENVALFLHSRIENDSSFTTVAMIQPFKDKFLTKYNKQSSKTNPKIGIIAKLCQTVNTQDKLPIPGVIFRFETTIVSISIYYNSDIVKVNFIKLYNKWAALNGLPLFGKGKKNKTKKYKKRVRRFTRKPTLRKH